MRAWLGTSTAGQKGQTRRPASAREADVRQEAKDTDSCFFTDLWRLNGDRQRGTPSNEYLERVREHHWDLLVSSYVSSYDVSRNPSVVEGESIQSVKKKRHNNNRFRRTMLMSLIFWICSTGAWQSPPPPDYYWYSLWFIWEINFCDWKFVGFLVVRTRRKRKVM